MAQKDFNQIIADAEEAFKAIEKAASAKKDIIDDLQQDVELEKKLNKKRDEMNQIDDAIAELQFRAEDPQGDAFMDGRFLRQQTALLNLHARKKELRIELEWLRGQTEPRKRLEVSRQRLEREFQDLKDLALDAKCRLIRGESREDVESLMRCPICLDIPQSGMQIRSCQRCQNIICQKCFDSGKPDKCPMCRKNWASNGVPQRNRWAERFINTFN